MPMLEKVPCSLMDDRTHSHCRSAGFKGALSFRADLGVPGYTGYCPSSVNIPLNLKCGTTRTGKLCDSKTLGELRDATNDTHTNSMYLATYRADPASYNPDNKKGGGYWLHDQVMPAAAPFNGTATYAAEIGNSSATADVQLQRSLGLNALTSASEQARQGRAGLNRTTPVNTPIASNGDLLGYTTNYGGMVAKGALTGGGAAAGAPRTRRAAPEARPWRAPRANPPRQTTVSRSTIDYGVAGSDPVSHMAEREATMTMHATTSDLAAGTERNTWHIPGYTGFQCATEHNKLAVEHSMGEKPRRDGKVSAALCPLQQYSRSRLPGTTTFKPVDPCNMTSVQPAHGPTIDSSYGLNNSIVAKYNAAAAPTLRAGIDPEHGIMGFFSAGASESVSDNGTSNAQQFYRLVRPLEGLAKHTQACKTTSVGGKFPAASLGL